ncbi:MAG: hypothetical protein KGQ49_04160 [Verrucomicrobia bacterium]|nr:hypothetical protein [Verrucomicrobiota bacterium]MBU6446571.1 hypothetical protein [Verrucomicrobiota bacterium]MDE3047290.1 hypothetical protein [Verrucomicrobiota bacterium]
MLRAQSALNDQFLVIFGSSGYALYKVLDFANDHGYRYCKILSYDFHAFHHVITGHLESSATHEGRYFELQDEYVNIAFLCFTKAPEDPMVIDVDKYRSILDDVRASHE